MKMERTLKIDGAHNFRDMGGYPTIHGKTVRWGKLYRSGRMTTITDEDAARLKALGIAAICDFRTTHERGRNPTKWHADSPTEMLFHEYDMSSAVLQNIVTAADASADQVSNLMVDIYRKLPIEQAVNYRILFRNILAGKMPLVFNCSAGKDRTGVAAALVLSALGVEREIVEQDYLLTNESIDNLSRILANEPKYGHIVRDNPAVALPLLRAESIYLEAMFDELGRTHGTIEAYLNDVLQVSAADIESMRANLTE